MFVKCPVSFPVEHVVGVCENTPLYVCTNCMTDFIMPRSIQVPPQRYTDGHYGSRTPMLDASTGCLCERILYIQLNCVIIRFVKQSLCLLFLVYVFEFLAPLSFYQQLRQQSQNFRVDFKINTHFPRLKHVKVATKVVKSSVAQ